MHLWKCAKIWAGPSPPHLDKIQKTSSIFSSPLENDLLASMLKNSQEGREQASWWAQCVPQTDANRPQLKLLGNQGAHQRSACFLLLVLFSLTIHRGDLHNSEPFIGFLQKRAEDVFEETCIKRSVSKVHFLTVFCQTWSPPSVEHVCCFSPPTNRLFKVAE